jgi:hypothetical protein
LSPPTTLGCRTGSSRSADGIDRGGQESTRGPDGVARPPPEGSRQPRSTVYLRLPGKEARLGLAVSVGRRPEVHRVKGCQLPFWTARPGAVNECGPAPRASGPGPCTPCQPTRVSIPSWCFSNFT